MWKYSSPGIPDRKFIRGRIPMTKQEIRVVTLAKACITPDAVIYDIGAGTGSLSVEAALLAPQGKVYAIEREAEGIALVVQNCRQFEVGNVEVIHGQAPAALEGLPKAQVVLIGGSGGHLADIITASAARLLEGGRIVINAITLETMTKAQTQLMAQGFQDLEIVSLAVTRWPQVGRSHMAQALNPVFILSATWPA